MRIISASRRTDIAAFYTPWLLNRFAAGFCEWRNPYNGSVQRVSLRPEDCLAVVVWSRNPRPLLPHLDRLQRDGHRFYFHISINGYPRAIETANPPLATAVATFRAISERLSPAQVQWRYDPIVLSDRTPAAYHVERFSAISRLLEGATERCTISFVDYYGKTARNLAKVSAAEGIAFEHPGLEEKQALLARLSPIAAARGITLASCCDDTLVGNGIAKARCIDPALVQSLQPDEALSLKAAPTREACGCVQATDIGTYDTCLFGCTYCYATNSRAAALRRREKHDPLGTMLAP